MNDNKIILLVLIFAVAVIGIFFIYFINKDSSEDNIFNLENVNNQERLESEKKGAQQKEEGEEILEGKLECSNHAKCFIVYKKTIEKNEFSSITVSNTLIKHKDKEEQFFPCEYVIGKNDFELEPTEKVLEVVGDFLITDSGTAASHRWLRVYDLNTNKILLNNFYSRPLDIEDNKIYYWSPTNIEVTNKNCPRISEYIQGGFVSAEIEERMVFDLDTLNKNNIDEYRCSYVE
jgi:hypothetical protein